MLLPEDVVRRLSMRHLRWNSRGTNPGSQLCCSRTDNLRRWLQSQFWRYTYFDSNVYTIVVRFNNSGHLCKQVSSVVAYEFVSLTNGCMRLHRRYELGDRIVRCPRLQPREQRHGDNNVMDLVY